jgi:hypothetical protein
MLRQTKIGQDSIHFLMDGARCKLMTVLFAKQTRLFVGFGLVIEQTEWRAARKTPAPTAG